MRQVGAKCANEFVSKLLNLHTCYNEGKNIVIATHYGMTRYTPSDGKQTKINMLL